MKLQCRICKVIKDEEEFHRDPTRKKRNFKGTDCKSCTKDYYNYLSVRKNFLMRDYGITPEQYEEIFEAQEGRCAICKKEESRKKRLSVDHCKVTKKIRGLLCQNCNMAIGLLDHSSPILQRAIVYLENNNL